MTEEQKIICKDFLNDADKTHSCNEYKLLMALLEQDSKEITLEDVKEYCKPRCLTIITNELYHELIHPKIKVLEQEQILDKIKPIVAEWKTNTWTNNFSCECMIKIAEIIDKENI